MAKPTVSADSGAMPKASCTVIRLNDYRAPPPPAETRQLSFYELYPMPFFDKATRCSWAVESSGNYSIDCDTGDQFARQFLESCDGTVGWVSLLGPIVTDMVRAGFDERGQPKAKGLIIGFMSVIASAATAAVMTGGMNNDRH